MESEVILRGLNVNTVTKNKGELMMIAAYHGLVNLIRFYEHPLYSIHFANSFGDTLLHAAIRGKQMLTIYYLMKRGVSTAV